MFRIISQVLDGEIDEDENCTTPSITEFPDDLFTQEQRLQGFVAIHFIVTIYVFYALTIVCDYYFVPSVEKIAKEFKIPTEIAGCTILGIANSSPELLTNVVGTFITEGDLGVGTIVGASVFNILAVGGCIGLFAGKIVHIQWWPITRDSFFYLISVGILFQALQDSQIRWYDVTILIALYFVYMLVIYFNSSVRRFVKKLIFSTQQSWDSKRDSYKLPRTFNDSVSDSTSNSSADLINSDDNLEKILDDSDTEEESLALWVPPYGKKWYIWCDWVLGWPIRFTLFLTIPDFRRPMFKRWYGLTFVMCVAWNTLLCYVIAWMVTVIGFTFDLSDSVMGLTVIAAGTSVPQVMSSIIVAKKGYGTMAMNNAIGSNIFNILICLGLPWLIQILRNINTDPYIHIYSLGLTYSTLMLLLSMIFLYILLLMNNFVFDKKLGIVFLFGYLVFLVIGSLFELNIFLEVNLPSCDI